MEVLIKGEVKEIADLVLILQDRQSEKFIPCDSNSERIGLNQRCSN